MQDKLQAVRGMKDTLPGDTRLWRSMEEILIGILSAYGYEEIRLPILEKTDLFKRSIGAVTDIVEKEMYTFVDRNGDSLTLRPEGTAGCVRAGIENGLLYNQTQKLWYMGPMFRHERPQKGRYRQFSQIGVEVFGLDGPDIDAELIFSTARMWKSLGLNELVLEINSLGVPESRQIFKKKLVDYFKSHRQKLDEDSIRRLDSNPMRILDSKNPLMKDLIDEAPLFSDYMDSDSKLHFQTLQKILNDNGIKYIHNPILVRGLDYYTHTVFEWTTNQLGAQSAVCAGGRYNGLVEQLGGKSTPAVGYALGLDRIVNLLEINNILFNQDPVHAFLISHGELAQIEVWGISELLRERIPGLKLISNCGSVSLKNQFKRADKCGAHLAIIVGEEELAQHVVGVKYLRQEKNQEKLNMDQLVELLKNIVNK